MADEPLVDLSIIIVSWNVQHLLRACLTSVRASPGICLAGYEPPPLEDEPPPLVDDLVSPFASRFKKEPGRAALRAKPPPPPATVEVIVVDNASTDGTAEAVAADFPWVRLLANSDNCGFAAANNQALALSRGRYVLFLNPDTEVTGDGLATMLAYMESHRRIGALGPRLRFADGSTQSSRRRFPTLATALFESTPLAWHWPDNHWAHWYRMEDVTSRQTQMVDWVVGAAMLVRRAALDQIGGFDEGYFMYSEEMDWCRRAATAGWLVAYLPAAQVIHHEGKSSEQNMAARHINFQTSKVRYFQKFHGRLAAGVLRYFLLAAFAFEWCLEAIKWTLGSRRRVRRDRLDAYVQLLRSGLRPERRIANTR